jgi:hypothetical protein
MPAAIPEAVFGASACLRSRPEGRIATPMTAELRAETAILTFFFMIVMLFSVCPSLVWIIITKFAVTTNQ